MKLYDEMYDVDVSVQWIIIMLFTAGVLAIATPPIPVNQASRLGLVDRKTLLSK